MIWQQANLAGFLAGCYTSDLPLIRESLLDVVIEPQRQVLIPGFAEVKQAALAAGALGCSISGAGPTVFAWAEAEDAGAGARRHGRGLPQARARERQLGVGDRPRGRAGGGRLMRFQSTRDPSHTLGLGAAIARGLAPDGGLYVPDVLPRVDAAALAPRVDLPELAARLLAPFAAGDVMADLLPAITRGRLQLPGAGRRGARRWRAAVGARAVPRARPRHSRISARASWRRRSSAFRAPDPRRLTILVATSGDTGGAVAAAFYDRPWVDVVVLYPRGLVSPRQEKQLACWGRNVRTLAVRGTFDDCQRMVKEAFVDPALAPSLLLSSANSINVGRLLPQMVYYAKASLELWRARRPCAELHRSRPATSATRWPASGRARSGCRSATSCSRRNANLTVPDFLRTRRVASAAERGDARLRDGRRQPEQHGAAALAVPGARDAARHGYGAVGQRRRDPRDDPPRPPRARPDVVPAHRDGGLRLRAAAGARRAASAGCSSRRRIRRSSTTSSSR